MSAQRIEHIVGLVNRYNPRWECVLILLEGRLYRTTVVKRPGAARPN